MDLVKEIIAYVPLVAVTFAAVSILIRSRNAKLQIQVTNLREYSKLYFEISPSDKNFNNFDKYFGMCYQEYILKKQGLLQRDIWKTWTISIKKNVNRDSFNKWWKEENNKNQFNKGFKKFINSKIQHNGS